MIIVTGATGPLGRTVVQQLVKRVPATGVRASVRDPEKAADLRALGARVRRGDFGDPQTLRSAFAGASQVLVVSVDQVGQTARHLHAAAIAAADAAGARRVLYTSHMGARADSPFSAAADHAAAEDVLAGSGLEFTALRHGFYAESALQLIAQGIEYGEIRAPEDGPVSWTARAELAEADAILLATEGMLDGVTPPLTAPEAFTMADIADIASELAGREIRRVTVSDDEWRDTTTAHGVPQPVADLLLGLYRAARRGDFATVDPTLGSLLGRRPQTIRDVLAAHLRR